MANIAASINSISNSVALRVRACTANKNLELINLNKLRFAPNLRVC